MSYKTAFGKLTKEVRVHPQGEDGLCSSLEEFRETFEGLFEEQPDLEELEDWASGFRMYRDRATGKVIAEALEDE